MNKEVLFSLVSMLNQHTSERLDDRSTATLAQQLEYVKSQTYDVKYPMFKARSLIPVSTDVPEGARTFTYYQWDSYGMARVVANFADDIPMVDVVRKKFTADVKWLASAYQFTIQDLAAMAVSGEQVDTRKGTAARRSIEAGIDDVAAFGLEDANIRGFVNHPNVPIISPDNGDWSNPSTTNDEILADLNKLVSSIPVATRNIFAPDTLVLDTETFELLSSRLVGQELTTSLLKVFLAASPHIRTIEVWDKLSMADVSGTGPRVIAYAKDPEVLQLEIPTDFKQLPQQARNLAFVVNCYAVIGGTCIRYPLGMAYMDGI